MYNLLRKYRFCHFPVRLQSLSLWNKPTLRYSCNTSHDFADKSWIPIDAYLEVVLKDLPWHPNLASNQSTEYKNLVMEFDDKVRLF